MVIVSSFLFVDGASLRAHAAKVVGRYFIDPEITFDLRPLAASFSKTFFYDAFPTREAGETDQSLSERTRIQQEILDDASRVDRLHVTRGLTRTPISLSFFAPSPPSLGRRVSVGLLRPCSAPPQRPSYGQ